MSGTVDGYKENVPCSCCGGSGKITTRVTEGKSVFLAIELCHYCGGSGSETVSRRQVKDEYIIQM